MSAAPETPRESEPAETGDRLDFGPLAGRLGYALRRVQIAVFRDFFDAFQPFAIKPAQYSILTLIELNPAASRPRSTTRSASSAPISSP